MLWWSTAGILHRFALPADVFPKSVVASVHGFGGMLFSWLTGRVIDQHGSMPVLIGYGFMPLTALMILLFLCGPLRRNEKFVSAPG
jgi:fucose permease